MFLFVFVYIYIIFMWCLSYVMIMRHFKMEEKICTNINIFIKTISLVAMNSNSS